MKSNMACCTLKTLGLLLGVIGTFGTFAITLMPQWKVTAFTRQNIITFEIHWKGLWKSCISQMGGVFLCSPHISMLSLETYLGVSRALMCIACVLSVIAFLIAVPGMKCFECVDNNEQIKSKFCLAAGVVFILTGIIVLIPVAWFTHRIIMDFNSGTNPNLMKYEPGEAIYLGWATLAFLITGGGLLCSFCHCAKKSQRCSLPSSDRMQKSEHVKKKPSSVHSYV